MAISPLEDANLDTTIQFIHPISPNAANPKAVFITGATGFLGAYLVAEFLKQIAADVYCLVRSPDQNTGLKRLKDHLQFYELWQEAYAEQIIPVCGDLAQPKFGLPETQWHELAERIDVIYHNGAQVNAVYPYARLKAANVDGTHEILRFASLRQTKPLHFVSSLGIFLSQAYRNQVVLETDIPTWDGALKGGYKQSKWVADGLVRQAQARGLPSSIYRPGVITEHSQSGIHGKTNNATSSIGACIQLEKYPILETVTNFSPVDYVSQAIVCLSQQETSNGKAFHLCNPASVAWQDLFSMLCTLGHPLQETLYDDWLKELESQVQQYPKNKAFALLRHLMRLPMNLFSEGPHFDVHQTVAGLADTSIVCPPIDKNLLALYF